MSLCSIVVPCYNEEGVVSIFYKEVRKFTDNIKDLEFEFIFIDDGSKDGTLNEMRSLAATEECVHYISL